MQKDVEEILLKIENLYIKYAGNPDKKYAVNDFSMELRNGEIVGILGESGAGKSSVGMGILSMIDPPNESKNRQNSVNRNTDCIWKR